jgi:hypothetical protein
MSPETAVREPESCKVEPAAGPRVIALQDIVEQVRHDSQQVPNRYLDESTVPHGGE